MSFQLRQLIGAVFILLLTVARSSTSLPISWGVANEDQQVNGDSIVIVKDTDTQRDDDAEAVMRITGRRLMMIDLTDYPGTGANTRHTPPPRKP